MTAQYKQAKTKKQTKKGGGMKKTMEEIEPKANTTRRPKYLWLRLQKDFSLKLGG